jgi:putative transcriptional regulator
MKMLQSYKRAMPIIVDIDVMLARRKMKSRELSSRIGITEQQVSLLKSGKIKGLRFDTLAKICHVLDCQPGELVRYEKDDADLLAGIE